MVGLCSAGVTALDGVSHIFTNRAVPRTVRVLPCQAVLLAGCADDLLRILIDGRVAMFRECVFVLRFDKSTTDLDRVQFIPADAAEKNFVQVLLSNRKTRSCPISQSAPERASRHFRLK